MKIYAISLLLAFCCPACLLYGDFQCPSSSERRLRAKWFCQKYGLKEEDYACLFDTIVNVYQEKCSFQANILDPGQKYILNHRPKSFECENADRYQPFGLQHFSDECVYLRSKCSEPGQVRYNDGSKTVDKSCRCNFAQGYAFVKTPKTRCFCTPSIEDCSCYLKSCPDSFILSSDYQCIHMNNKSFQPSCPGMNNQEKPWEDTTLHKRDFHDHSFKDPTFHSGDVMVLIAVFMIIIVVISCYLGQDKMPAVCLIQISPPTKLKTFSESGFLTLTWTSPVQDHFKIEFYKILYTSNEWKDTKNINVKATQLSCTIPNVLPMKTYRFTISSCLKNFEGKPSIEHLFESGGPLPPTELTTMKDSGSLILTWTSPLQDLFEVDLYKILYTSDEWNHMDHISVDVKKSSHKIPNILPMMTYRFKIASCLNNFEGKPSLEHRFQSGTPIPPTELDTFPDDGDLILTWISPIQDLFQVVCYKLLYTSNEWCDTEHIIVDVMKSSSIIPSVLPLKTYRFKIASCLTNFDGKSSAEHKFQSGRPNCPPTLDYFLEKGNKRNIRLVWTSPVETLFKTKSYHLEITQDDWKNMSTFSLPASALQYVINDFTVDATYRFKLYSVSHFVRSLPTQKTCFASPRYLVKIQLNGPVHEDALHNKSSDLYNVLKEGIEDAAKTAFTDCPGNQVVADIEFSRGSFYAVFILISQGCHNEEKLRIILEETIKTGKFGRFLVSMEGFIFKALDNPIPPQFDHIEIVDTVINISWAKEKETFFKTKNYLLQLTTDDWKSCEEILTPADQNQYSILDTLPSTKYKFKIVTIAQGDIESLPSKEIYIITRDILREDEEEYFQQLFKVVHTTVFSAVKKMFEKEYTQSEVEKFISQQVFLSSKSGKLISCFQDIKDDMEILMKVILGLKGYLPSTKCDLVLPKESDIDLISDLIRVEVYRKKLQNMHSGRLSKEEFESCRRILKDATTRLSQKNVFIPQVIKDQDVIIHLEEKIQADSNDSLDSHQLVISTWEEENVRFQMTDVVHHILDALKTVYCVTITGEAGVGKTITMHHVALHLRDQYKYCIVPCTNTTDIKLFYKYDKDQIFVLDDICGKYTINQSMLDDFVDNKTSFNLFMKKGKAKFITTCRTQIFQEKKFQKLKYLTGTSFDLSLRYPLTVQEKLAIANEYLETSVIERIRDGIEHYSFFPLRCKLYNENPVQNPEKFFDNPFDMYKKELNRFYQEEERVKYCALFLFVAFNGSINETFLTEDKLRDKGPTINTLKSVFVQFNVNSRVILESLDSFVGVYLKKVNAIYYAIHDKMFDFLCSYFGEKSQGNFIEFADVDILMNRTKLQMSELQDIQIDELTVLISKQHEIQFFQRIVIEIEKRNIHKVCFSRQMEDEYFRRKFINYLSTMESVIITTIAGIKDKLKNFRGENYNRNTLLSAAALLGHAGLVRFALNYIDDKNNGNVQFAFQQACVGGYLPVVHLFIKKGTAIDKGSAYNGWTPLMYACDKGHLNVIKLLIKNTVNVNASNSKGTTALMVACDNKKIGVCCFLISAGADVNATDKMGRTSLLISCAVGSFEIVEHLITAGADVNAKCTDEFTRVQEQMNSLVNTFLGEQVEQNGTENSGWTALHLSTAIGNKTIVKLLLEKGSHVDAVNKEGSTPLMLACRKGYSYIVELLIKAKCNIHILNKQLRNAFSMACENSSLTIVKMLIKKNVQINQSDVEGKTPLYYAIRNGKSSIVNELLKEGSLVNVSGLSRHSPVLIAAAYGQEDCLRKLIQHGAKINIPDKLGCTALHIASSEGFDSCVALLLTNKGMVDKEDKKGWTPLMYCCERGYANTFTNLVEFSANINYVCKTGNTPLTIACEYNNINLIELLIQKGAKLDQCDIHGVTPLGVASNHGLVDVIQLLVSKGADVNKGDFKGWTPLKIACSCGHYGVAKVLLEYGCNINLAGIDGWTPLISACKGGNISLIDLLIHNNANTNIANRSGWTPLKVASLFRKVEVIDLLLENGAKINQSDKASWTPLMTACQAQNIKVVDKLICKGANVNYTSCSGTTALLLVCKNGNTNIVRNLIANGADFEKSDEKGQFPIYISCLYGHNLVLDVLISSGASVNQCDNLSDSALKVAILRGELSIIKTLINANADVNIKDKNGNTPLFYACTFGNLEIVNLLIKSGSNMTKTNFEGWTPLMFAIKNRHDAIKTFLLMKGCNIDNSSLFFACESGNTEMINFFISNGCDINVENNDGLTPLMVAYMHNHYDIIDILRVKGALFSKDLHILRMFLRRYDEQGFTMLTKACQTGHEQSVQLLLTNGADISLCDNYGWSPMTRACFGGYKSIVKYLTSHGVDIQEEDKNKQTPFSVAIEKKQNDVVELIVKSCNTHFDLNATNKQGLTPLMSVCRNGGHASLAKLLISNGALISESGIDNLTPLEIACKYENLDCLDFLLASGAVFRENSKIRDSQINNPDILNPACKAGYKHVVDAFLTPDFDIDREFDDEFSLLMLACHSGHHDVVNVLCGKGASVNKKNSSGLFPLMIATNGNYIHIINILVDHRAIVDAYDNDGFTPLMKACEKGAMSIIKTLINKNADINLEINKNSPLCSACVTKQYAAVNYLLKVGVYTSKYTIMKCFIDDHDTHSKDLLALSCKQGYDYIASYIIQCTDLRISQYRNYLLTACKYGQETIVFLLVKHGANVNVQDTNKRTPLFLGSEGGYCGIVRSLLTARADSNKSNREGQTPLHAACLRNNFEIVKVLLESDVNVNAADKKGVTPLAIASKQGNANITKFLIDKCAKIEAADTNGWNALMVGVEEEHEHIVDFLIQHGASVNAVSNDGITPLIIASKCGHAYIAKYLIERKATINKKDNKGRTPLQEACINNHISVVKLLLLNGATVNSKDNDGYTPLMSACKNSNNKIIIETLLNYEANPNDASLLLHYTPLRIACNNYNIENIMVLLRANADRSITDKNGVTPLHAVCDLNIGSNLPAIKDIVNTCLESFPFFLSTGLKFELNFSFDDLETLQIDNTACHIIQLLLDREFDIDTANTREQTALMVASRFGRTTVVKFLISIGASVNKRDSDGRTALSHACIDYQVHTVKCLLVNGATIDILDNKGETPLITACNFNCSSLILNTEVDLKKIKTKQLNVIQLLLEYNADVNKSRKDGCNPLMLACRWHSVDIVRCLIDNGADVLHKNIRSECPLLFACRRGNFEAVEFLIENGADPFSVDQDEVTILKYTCDSMCFASRIHVENLYDFKRVLLPENIFDDPLMAYGPRIDYTSIVKTLIKCGVDINKADIHGWTPLMMMCRRGFKYITDMLINQGADVNVKTPDGLNAFMIACIGGNLEIVRLLLEKSDINEISNNGWSSLKHACKNGYISIVELLLKRGACVDQQDNEGWTPLMSACQCGHEEIVHLLLKNKADANKYSFDRCHPLKLAKQGNFRHIELLLIEYGSCINENEDDEIVDD